MIEEWGTSWWGMNKQTKRQIIILDLSLHFTFWFCQKHFYTEHGPPWPPWYRCESMSRDVCAARRGVLSKFTELSSERNFPSVPSHLRRILTMSPLQHIIQLWWCAKLKQGLFPYKQLPSPFTLPFTVADLCFVLTKWQVDVDVSWRLRPIVVNYYKKGLLLHPSLI